MPPDILGASGTEPAAAHRAGRSSFVCGAGRQGAPGPRRSLSRAIAIVGRPPGVRRSILRRGRWRALDRRWGRRLRLLRFLRLLGVRVAHSRPSFEGRSSCLAILRSGVRSDHRDINHHEQPRGGRPCAVRPRTTPAAHPAWFTRTTRLNSQGLRETPPPIQSCPRMPLGPGAVVLLRAGWPGFASEGRTDPRTRRCGRWESCRPLRRRCPPRRRLCVTTVHGDARAQSRRGRRGERPGAAVPPQPEPTRS